MMEYYDMPEHEFRGFKGTTLPDPVALTPDVLSILEESQWDRWSIEGGQLVIPKMMNIPLVGRVDTTEKGNPGDLLLLFLGEPKILKPASAAHWVPSEQTVLTGII